MASKYDRVVKSDPRSPRYFKACDVARIAENCVADTGTPEYILLACVAKRLGYERVWVEDKELALQSEKYSFKKAMADFALETERDVISIYQGANRNSDPYEVLMDKTVERAALAAERGIGIVTMTAVEALEEGISVFINWTMYRFYRLLRFLPHSWGYIVVGFISRFVEWVAGMLEGFTHSISVDVDDVLQANKDWCTCMQAEQQGEFGFDKKAAKDFEKNRKKTKLQKPGKPGNLPTTIGG